MAAKKSIMLLSWVELFASVETLGCVEVLAGAGFCCARDR